MRIAAAADVLVAAVVGGPIRATLIGVALLWLGARYLGWFTLALIGAGCAWEFVRWPGRAPGRQR